MVRAAAGCVWARFRCAAWSFDAVGEGVPDALHRHGAAIDHPWLVAKALRRAQRGADEQWVAVGFDLGVFHPALLVDPVTHRALSFEPLVEGALRIGRGLLGNRQELAAGGGHSLGLARAFGCRSRLLTLDLFALLGQALLLELLAGLGLAALALLFTPLRLALALLLLFKALLLGAFARQGGLFQTLAFDGRIGLRRLRRLGNHGRRLRRYRRGQGQQLLLNLRRQDLLCRLAGDRFVALLPGTGAQQAQQIAGELQDAVRHLAYRSSRNGERLRLSASVASVLAQDEDGESLLRRLNLALAHAKQAPAVKRA